MHHTYLKRTHAAEHAGIFSWDEKQKMVTPSSSTVHSLHCVPFFFLLSLTPPKPNLAPYFLTAKMA
jgi:hypothetical protein